MKKTLLLAALITLPLSMSLASAEETHPDMGKKSAAMSDKDKEMNMTKMQENMLKMHELMHKIMDAKNPQEREQLMQQHAKLMQDGMQMMKGMKGSHEMMSGHTDGSSKMDSTGKPNMGATEGGMGK